MREHSKELTAEISDGIILAMIAAFTAWVTLTQSPTLAAPTTALCTAALLTPKVKSPYKTFADKINRPLVGIGTTLTAFLWLLSTTQPTTDIMPTKIAEAFIILIGLFVATIFVALSPLVFIIPRFTFNKDEDDHTQSRFQDYTLGIVGSSAVFVLVFFMLRVSKGIVGPIENEGIMIAFAAIAAPVFGWLFVFAERKKKFHGSQEVKKDH